MSQRATEIKYTHDKDIKPRKDRIVLRREDIALSWPIKYTGKNAYRELTSVKRRGFKI